MLDKDIYGQNRSLLKKNILLCTRFIYFWHQSMLYLWILFIWRRWNPRWQHRKQDMQKRPMLDR